MIEASLQALATSSARPSVFTGTVSAVTQHATWGVLVEGMLRPTGREFQARLAAVGARAGEGLWLPVAAGDEVLVVAPDGDLNRAVAVAGLPSRGAAPPSGWDNSAAELVAAGGVAVRKTQAQPVEPVVLESLLEDLRGALQELQAGLAGLGIPTPTTTTFLAKLATQYRSRALKAE